MPMFRFEFEEEELIEGVTPIEFSDYEAAIDAATQAARDTLIDAALTDATPRPG